MLSVNRWAKFFIAITVSTLVLSGYELRSARAIPTPMFQSGICSFDGPERATEITRNLPDASCSISVRKKFKSTRYILTALTGHVGSLHYLWRGTYITLVSSKSRDVCRTDSSDSRIVVGLKPGVCTVTLKSLKATRSTPMDNTKKGDVYSGLVIINFTK